MPSGFAIIGAIERRVAFKSMSGADVTAPMLADALGPRARRRVRIVSIVVGAVLVGLLAIALNRLADKGQLDGEPLGAAHAHGR